MRCMSRGSARQASRAQGFTLVEMLVVTPMVILMLGVIIAMLVNLSSSAMRASAQANLQSDILTALDMMEQDIKLSKNIEVSADANGFKTTNFATNKNPLDPNRKLINKDGCSEADNVELDKILTYTTAYYIDKTVATSWKVVRKVDIVGCDATAWQRDGVSTLINLGANAEYELTTNMTDNNTLEITLMGKRKIAGEEIKFTGRMYAKALNVV